MAYSPDHSRSSLAQFNKHKNFVMVKAGTRAKLLEDEFNEMQWNQNELRARLVKNMIYSGLLELVQPSCEPDNVLKFLKFVANVNGYLVVVNGNENQDGFNRVTLSGPTSSSKTDLLFLEVWFKEIEQNDYVYKYGGIESGVVDEDERINSSGQFIFDSRINAETSRFIQLQWRIREVTSVDFNTYEEGVNDPKVKARCANTSDTTYTFTKDNDDLGLYVAGDGTTDAKTILGTVDGYSYAIPIFRINYKAYTDVTESDIVNIRDQVTNKIKTHYDDVLLDTGNSVKDYLVVYYDNQIRINHNLGNFPLVNVFSKVGFGDGGYGLYNPDSIVQILSRVEYIDENSLIVHLEEQFEGDVTVSGSGKEYTVSFSDYDNDIIIQLHDFSAV